MGVGPQQHGLKVLGVAVHGAGDKTCIGTHGKSQRVERMVDTAKMAYSLVTLCFPKWGILSLGQPVYLIIEQEDIDIKVPAEEVNRMVSADTQSVAVARYHPNAEFGPGGFQPLATAVARPWMLCIP